jgi:site-specific recombinase XerD
VRGILDGYLLPAFGTRPLSSVTHLEVRGWVAELSASGFAPRSVRKVAQTLGKVYAAAVDAPMVAASPCDRVPLPGTEHDEMRCLTPAEVKTLAEAIDLRYRAFVLVGAYGGLRLGD